MSTYLVVIYTLQTEKIAYRELLPLAGICNQT